MKSTVSLLTNIDLKKPLGANIVIRNIILGLWLMPMLAACSNGHYGAPYSLDYAPPQEFLIGPEDILEVAVWRNEDLTREIIVRPDGKISLPLIGDIPAAGLTAEELGSEITSRLEGLVRSPKVSVTVKEVNSHFIYVLGEVTKPGKHPLKSHTTVLQAISLAGGFTPFASENDMRVLRKVVNEKGLPAEVTIPVRYDDLLLGTPASPSEKSQIGNFYCKTGDVIVVP